MVADVGDVGGTTQTGELIEAELDGKIRDSQQSELLGPGERVAGVGHTPMIAKGSHRVSGRM